MTDRAPVYSLPGHHPLLPRPGRRVAPSEAMVAPEVPTRYACAHVAALRAAAALLAARAQPGARPGAAPQKNAWVLLAEVAPELAEWAAFFAAGAGQAGRGRGRVDPGGHRARGRRPGPRRRPVPGRGRAGAGAGARTPPLQPASGRRRQPVRPTASDRQRRWHALRPLRPPPRGLRLLPAVRRLPPARRWSSGPPSRRWTPSPSPTATAPTARSSSPRPASPGRHPAGARGRPRRPAGPGRIAGRGAGPARPRTPVRGGAFRDDRRLPRVTFLATRAAGPGRAGRRCAGWSRRPTWPVSAAPRCADLDLLAGPGSRRRRRDGAARPASELGRGRDPAPRRPRPRRARAVARGGARATTSSSSWSPTGCPAGRALGSRHHPARRPDGRVRPQRRARARC